MHSTGTRRAERVSWPQRCARIGAAAEPTASGVKLDLSIYVYPNGQCGLTADSGRNHASVMVPDRERLLAALAEVVRAMKV